LDCNTHVKISFHDRLKKNPPTVPLAVEKFGTVLVFYFFQTLRKTFKACRFGPFYLAYKSATAITINISLGFLPHEEMSFDRFN
jgi:hypothetical protein